MTLRGEKSVIPYVTFYINGTHLTNRFTNDSLTRLKQAAALDAGIIFTRFHQRIFRYLFYRAGDAHTAEDLTGDVFLKMVQALPEYHAGAIPFEAWLFQIARNVAIDYYRRSSARPVVAIDDELDSDDPSVDEVVDIHLTQDGLLAAISRLPEIQQDVLLMRFFEGLPIAETALILHRSEDAIKSLQRRGLQALRRHLTKKGERP